MAAAGNRIQTKRRVATPRARSPWAATAIKVKPGTQRVFDVTVKLQRLVAAFGENAAAELLALDPGQMLRCLRGREKISVATAQRIIDFEYMVDCALRVFHPDELGPWLGQPEPLLGDAIPLNVLVLRGTSPVIAALSRIAAGAYA
jgi:uncharacterized protein (DUF2384 family)